MISDQIIKQSIPQVLDTVDLPDLGEKHSGKVRDFYIKNDKRILITTDRQSAFNYNLGLIPFKGTVLNLLSKFWFEKAKNIVSNHMIHVPDPNVMITHNCKPIPVEMIVRGYMTGVTNTSIWYSYDRGEREIYGITFPDGLQKNDKLPRPVLTPTTHPDPESGIHDDERLTRDEIIEKGIVNKKLYEQMEQAALALFEMGSNVARNAGLILVDTKYEFGIHDGKLMQIDEMHTPDSSRFWTKDSYDKLIKIRTSEALNRAEGSGSGEPDNFDKEFLRLYYANNLGYTGGENIPEMPEELIIALAKRYIEVYEKLTGETFPEVEYPMEERIKKNVKNYFK